MAYAKLQDSVAASKRHDDAKKYSCNPGRTSAFLAARIARTEVLELSRERWVSPKMIAQICVKHMPPSTAAVNQKKCIEFCIRGIPGSAEGGVFLGVSPFMPKGRPGPKPSRSYGTQIVRDEFLKRLPRKPKDDAKVELLVLELLLKSKQRELYEILRQIPRTQVVGW